MIYNRKLLFKLLLCLLAFALLFNAIGIQSVHAASGGVLGVLTSPTMPTGDGGGSLKIIDTILSFLFEKILGPILNILASDDKNTATSKAPSDNKNVVIKPLPPKKNDPPPPAKSVPLKPGALKGKIIVVDPGHGGSNPGAVANGVRESDVNLSVGLKLKERLEKDGAKVIMTRDTDRKVNSKGTTLGEELASRVTIASQNNADIFVSIHANYNPNSSIKGAMTFYHNNRSKDLAQKIQNGLIAETGADNKGIETASFHVIRNTVMPSVLVETGFLSNAAEAKLLSNNNYQNSIANGIYSGIVRYFNSA